jgi:MGT family glycosyltransferase
MTGPILFDYPAPMPEWIDELDDGTPNVYITMGSTGVVYDAVRASFEALAKLPYRFIVTTGGQVNRDAFGDIPRNFRVTAFAPGNAILARARALVFHGGNGSMYQALQHGVPMLAIPTHNEQRINARIAERHGFCRLLEFRRAQNGELRDAIVSVVENESSRSAAQRMAESVRASNGAATTAERIERIAREGKPAGA